MKTIKRKGISKKIMKAHLMNSKFIRVTNVNQLNETINISLYKELIGDDNNIDYVKVFPDELPMNIVNKLTIDSTYEKVNQEEAEEFLNKLKSQQMLIEDNNTFNAQEYLKVDTICDCSYILAKEKENKFYALSTLRTNEYGVIKGQSIASPVELPYILMNILEKNNFDSVTILILQDHFVRIVKEKNKYLCIIYQFSDNEGKPLVKTLDLFTIVETENEFALITEKESELFVKIDEVSMRRYSKDFLETIGLDMVE